MSCAEKSHPRMTDPKDLITSGARGPVAVPLASISVVDIQQIELPSKFCSSKNVQLEYPVKMSDKNIPVLGMLREASATLSTVFKKFGISLKVTAGMDVSAGPAL